MKKIKGHKCSPSHPSNPSHQKGIGPNNKVNQKIEIPSNEIPENLEVVLKKRGEGQFYKRNSFKRRPTPPHPIK